MTGRVVVLGGKGLVGSHLAELAPSWTYLGREIDPLNEASWNNIQIGDKIVDLVPPALPREEQGQNQANYLTQKLRFMDWCAARGVARYVFLSSGGSIYGRHANGKPLKESADLQPVSQYGQIKQQEEAKLASLSHMSSIALRVGNIYPRLTCREGRGGFIAAAVRSLTQDKPMMLFGDLGITKHFVSADDVAQAIKLAVSSSLTGAVNIAASSAHTLQDVAAEVEKQLGKKLHWEVKPMLANDVPWFVLDLTKAKNELGYSPQIKLATGIHSMLKEWRLA